MRNTLIGKVFSLFLVISFIVTSTAPSYSSELVKQDTLRSISATLAASPIGVDLTLDLAATGSGDAKPKSAGISQWSDLDYRLRAAQLCAEWQVVEMLSRAGSGHPKGSINVLPVVISAHFGESFRYDSTDPDWENRDRLVFSGGHTAPGIYASYAGAGYKDRQSGLPLMEQLHTLRQRGSPLQGHIDMIKTPVDMSAGSLGKGPSAAAAMALAAKIDGRDNFVECVIGDSESTEGQIPEAMEFAGLHQLDNLIIWESRNGKGLTGDLSLLTKTDNLERARAAGFYTVTIKKGDNALAIELQRKATKRAVQQRRENLRRCEEAYNDLDKDSEPDAVVNAALEAVDQARAKIRPTYVQYITTPGGGLPGMAAHGAVPSQADADKAIGIIKQKLSDLTGHEPDEDGRDAMMLDMGKNVAIADNQKGQIDDSNRASVETMTEVRSIIAEEVEPVGGYEPSDKVATRTAGGHELVNVMLDDPDVVPIDLELAGSVKVADAIKAFGLFHWIDNPSGRVIEAGCREISTASMAAGLATCGKVPISHTFASFVPMMAEPLNTILNTNLPWIVVGTHAGLATGPDGRTHQDPYSQKIMGALPGLELAEACDAEEARVLHRHVVNTAKSKGMKWYERRARLNTPIIDKPKGWEKGARRGFYLMYENDAVDSPGSEVDVVIVSVGTQAYDAIEAAKALAKQGISACVINVTQHKALTRNTRNMRDFAALIRRGANLVTVCDAVAETIGEYVDRVKIKTATSHRSVQNLGIQKWGESATPAELYSMHGFDKDGIERTARYLHYGWSAIASDLRSGDPQVREGTVITLKIMYPDLAASIDRDFASLPISGEDIFNASKAIKIPVPACNIDNGRISELQIRALMLAAMEKDAFLMFEVGPGALLTYDKGAYKLAEYCARAAQQIYEETGYAVQYAVHLDHNQIKRDAYYAQTPDAKEDALNVALMRQRKAMDAGSTSFSIDTSTLTLKEEADVLERLRPVIETAAVLLEDLHAGAFFKGIRIGVEGEVGHIGDKLTTKEEALTYYKGLVALLANLPIEYARMKWQELKALARDTISDRYGIDIETEVIIHGLAIESGTLHGYDWNGDDTLRAYPDKLITADDFANGVHGIVRGVARRISTGFRKSGISADGMIVQHGGSGIPTKVLHQYFMKGDFNKLNINTDWQAIMWKILEAWDPESTLFKEIFGLAHASAMAKKAKAEAGSDHKTYAYLTGDLGQDFQNAKHRVIYGFARQLFRKKSNWPLLQEIIDFFTNRPDKMSLVERTADQAAADARNVRIEVEPNAEGLTAIEALTQLTQARGEELFDALGLVGKTNRLRQVNRPAELPLHNWQIDALRKRVKRHDIAMAAAAKSNSAGMILQELTQLQTQFIDAVTGPAGVLSPGMLAEYKGRLASIQQSIPGLVQASQLGRADQAVIEEKLSTQFRLIGNAEFFGQAIKMRVDGDIILDTSVIADDSERQVIVSIFQNPNVRSALESALSARDGQGQPTTTARVLLWQDVVSPSKAITVSERSIIISNDAKKPQRIKGAKLLRVGGPISAIAVPYHVGMAGALLSINEDNGTQLVPKIKQLYTLLSGNTIPAALEQQLLNGSWEVFEFIISNLPGAHGNGVAETDRRVRSAIAALIAA